MFEVEAKVHITKAQRRLILEKLEKTAKFKGKSFNKDAYYGRDPGFSLRIREKDGSTNLCIKQKKVERGIETNKEIEIPISSKLKFEKVLEDFGFKKYDDGKTKKSILFTKGSLLIEVNEITSLGYFLEIEKQVESKKEVPKAKKELEAIFKTFGFSSKQFEKRYYLDMLSKLNV
jgi:predicted adenylyl cyclase CyaB